MENRVRNINIVQKAIISLIAEGYERIRINADDITVEEAEMMNQESGLIFTHECATGELLIAWDM